MTDNRVLILRRHRILVLHDPRCYDGAYYDARLIWSDWETFERVSVEKVDDRLKFWRSLNEDAVKARGEGAICEYKLA